MRNLQFMNNDLAFEVFSRLLAKDLHKLKFVSKDWESLISDSSFVRLHLSKKEPLSGFFFQEKFNLDVNDIERVSYIPLSSERNASVHTNVLSFLPESVVVLDSCDGLVCCRSTLSAKDPKFYVCNPLNKEWTCLKWFNPSKEISLAFAFDKSSSSPLGRLDFKVLAVSGIESVDMFGSDECELSFNIYSSLTKTWKISTEICRCNDMLASKKGVFANGSIYWLTKGDDIIMFNPKLELSCSIPVPLPTSQLRMNISRCIGESQGKLHYVLFSEFGLQLWVLEDPFNFLWDTRFVFTVDELQRKNPEFLYNLSSQISSNTAAVMSLLIDILAFKDDVMFIRVSTHVYFFNFETGTLRMFCSLSDLGQMSINSPIVIPYSMSLVPLVSG